MLKAALTISMIVGAVASGQAQSDTTSGADKADPASAYYHYTMAVMYARMAAASGGVNREYVNKAIENYKAAIKADPATEELLDIYTRGPRPLLVIPPPPPAADRSRPR